MSHYDYEVAKHIAGRGYSLTSLIMAAARGAGTETTIHLRQAFPGILAELDARDNAPGGILPDERKARVA